MRKPNYSMERKDRERAKQAKAAAKLEKRSANAGDQQPAAEPPAGDDSQPRDVGGVKPGD
jgi:hypothetical protein